MPPRRLLCEHEKPTPRQMREQAIAKHPNLDFTKAVFTERMMAKLIVRCTVHDIEYTNFTYSTNVKREGHRTPCKKCSVDARAAKRRFDADDYIKQCEQKHNNKYKYINNTFKGVVKPMTIICPVEGHGRFQQQANVHLKGHGCPLCGHAVVAAALTMTTEIFIERAKALHGDKYDYSGAVYGKNGRDKVKLKCKKMGHEFSQAAEDHLASKGCCLCNKASKGELKVADTLMKKNIKFTHEKIFRDCKDASYLRFDFHLPDLNMCIEFDGEQHYEGASNRGGDDALKKQQAHDRMKDEYCVSKNISINHIKFDEDITVRINEIIDNYNGKDEV